MDVNKKLMLWLVVFALAIPLMLAGTAGAMYLTDGAKEVSPGVYDNPNDGMCVIGIAPNGDMLVDPLITNARDCAVNNTGLSTMVTGPSCSIAGYAGNDGYRHTWSTSICVDGSGNPISRVDLDNTVPMCKAKGGTIVTTGKCVAYGWQYRGVKSDGSVVALPATRTTTHGPAATDGLGFCYAPMRMTTANNYIFSTLTSTVADACPSYHNVSTVASFGSNTALRDTEWVPGTDGVLYQTQASYDAGLGWSFASGQCVYAYGVTGYANAAIVKVDGTNLVGTGGFVDLTQFTTMGDCLANGGSWDNWLPTGTGVAPYAADLAVTTTPNGSTIKKLDATTPIASGGGKFYSGTGSVCLKCHADQSRAYQERDKPAVVNTGHKKAGDTATWATIGSEWGLKGVQCTICHATGKPTQQDVGIVISPNTTGANAGLPRAASGHNQTEYGSHVNGVCYYCHGTNNSTPATVIPVADNAKNLAPISNQFLNSPHAKYTGTGATLDIVTKANYGSTFVGNVCRTGEVNARVLWSDGFIKTGLTVTSSTPTCAAAGGIIGTAGNCFATATTCATLPGGVFNTTYDLTTYPTATWGGGVCSAVGVGSILTTYWDGTEAKKIHFLDTASNLSCSGTGTYGASAFWVNEGEGIGTANGVAFAAGNQGNCMTCHDVHWSMGDTSPHAEPLRRECATCHENSASLSNATQIDGAFGMIGHPRGGGTPWDQSISKESCTVCHMAAQAVENGAISQPLHVWRINTDVTYTTMGATNMNLAGNFDEASVDLDLACGQCHGGSNGAGATHYGAMYMTKSLLNSYARGIHQQTWPRTIPPSATPSFVWSVDAATSYLVNFNAGATTCPTGETCSSYAWDFGDGASATGVTTSHQYAGAGTFNATLTVTVDSSGVSKSIIKTVSPVFVNHAPVAVNDLAASTSAAPIIVTNTTNNVTFNDASTDVDGNILSVSVNWGDGVVTTQTGTGGVFTHNYTRASKFTIIHTVRDTGGKSSVKKSYVRIVPPKYVISGTVTVGGTPISGVYVSLKYNGRSKAGATTTSGSPNFTFPAQLPGVYTMTIYKSGCSFTPPGNITLDAATLPVTITGTCP